MNNPQYYNFNSRLALFRTEGVDTRTWEDKWSTRKIADLLARYGAGKLDEFADVFTRYLPSNLPVLEAGCGAGQIVMALAARGYRVEGIDYAAETIARIKEAAPELNLRVADINHIDAPDETYGGYISLGVVEHNPAGPLPSLLEARRVLHPNGYAFISVPYLNPARQRKLRKARQAVNVSAPESLKFYQYYFGAGEFEELLNEAGFQVVELFPYAVYAGLTRDFSFGTWLDQSGVIPWFIHRRIRSLCQHAPDWMRLRFAHMIMFICSPAQRT